MLAGMYVTHQGQPRQVVAIQTTTPAYATRWDYPSTWTLAPLDGGPVYYLTDPKAEDVPLLPACDTHGTRAGYPCSRYETLAHAAERAGMPAEWQRLVDAENASPTNPF